MFLSIGTSSVFSQVKKNPSKEKAKKGVRIHNKKKPATKKQHTLPGVYIDENATAPVSITQVKTAVPAFIGYTEKGPKEPTQISSMTDYKNLYGGPSAEDIGEFEIDRNGSVSAPAIDNDPKYKMYYMLQLFFANGGRDCFITSVGHYDEAGNAIKNEELLAGLALLKTEDVPTLILFPDAISSKNQGDSTELYKAALAQSAEKKDRFLICDVAAVNNNITKSANAFRFSMGTENLAYGAAYFPPLKTSLTYAIPEDEIQVKLKANDKKLVLRHTEDAISTNSGNKEASLYHTENGRYRSAYRDIKNTIQAKKLELPPSAAIAGVYAKVDASRGVWKAPANISLNKVSAPKITIDKNAQAALNVHSSGKSINAIRSFRGRGVLVWGARTLVGNDPEWKYVSVKRLAIAIEESVTNALKRFAHEPNDAATWAKVKAMTENYLTTLWRSGALNGIKPEQAFFVNIGLGKSMTSRDIQEGNMVMEIGLAALKPSEFIVLRFSQKMNSN
ncbi:phage tail sheath family protein [Marixanthomonas spongiae]|uniref:Phage tail sheath family protein n=2 Tax=Marixanthomonas spongiae TaxID=2174845 RepID=A0A2U0I2I3_9FLAO|nr:phage tail sheath family protein [Marixanthomonas spongiae]